MDRTELVTELRDGATIAEVARDRGVAVSDVVDAIVTAEQARLDDLVAAGRLTRARADRLAADLEEHATDLVNGVNGEPWFAHRGHHPRFTQPGFGVPGWSGGSWDASETSTS